MKTAMNHYRDRSVQPKASRRTTLAIAATHTVETKIMAGEIGTNNGLRTETVVGALTTPDQNSRFRLMAPSQLRELATHSWIVRNIFPSKGFACIYGAPASGKSFLCLDLGGAIAKGSTWFAHKVKQAPVVYCVLEGESGFKFRAAAWEGENGNLSSSFLTLMDSFDLSNVKDVEELGVILPKGGVLIIDTLNRAAPFSDENSSKDVGQIICSVKHLQNAMQGLVILVHHTGKDARRGLRGHSSLIAALDVAIEVSKKAEEFQWTVAKAKDATDGAAFTFTLAEKSCGQDDEGNSITSCVVEYAPTATGRTPQGVHQKRAFEILTPLIKVAAAGKPGAPPGRQCILKQTAVEAIVGGMPEAIERPSARANEALRGLVNRGFLGQLSDWIWLA